MEVRYLLLYVEKWYRLKLLWHLRCPSKAFVRLTNPALFSLLHRFDSRWVPELNSLTGENQLALDVGVMIPRHHPVVN